MHAVQGMVMPTQRVGIWNGALLHKAIERYIQKSKYLSPLRKLGGESQHPCEPGWYH